MVTGTTRALLRFFGAASEPIRSIPTSGKLVIATLCGLLLFLLGAPYFGINSLVALGTSFGVFFASSSLAYRISHASLDKRLKQREY